MSINMIAARPYARFAYLLCTLVCLLLWGSPYADAAMKGHKKKKTVSHKLTVAAIRPANNEDTFLRISFLQSARFYKLPKDANPMYLQLLKESMQTHNEVTVERATEESDVIVSVAKQ